MQPARCAKSWQESALPVAVSLNLVTGLSAQVCCRRPLLTPEPGMRGSRAAVLRLRLLPPASISKGGAATPGLIVILLLLLLPIAMARSR